MQVWCEDEAGPYQSIPYLGSSWATIGQPLRSPHEYVRGKTAKLLTLFYPETGYVIGKGVKSSTNAILHPWIKKELEEVIKKLPPYAMEETEEERYRLWKKWQEGLKEPFTLPKDLPPLRVLLVLDNLMGHKTASFVLWLVEHGVMPLYTPIAGSWLNMAESIQGILKRRALDGQQPTTADEIIEWLEEAVRSWDSHPTPFKWGGKRAQRRKRSREKYKSLKGSGAMIQDQKMTEINHYIRGK